MTPARLIAAVCVIAPFVAVLWVPIFDKDKPEVAGFPFFFWWQLLWVAITAALMGLAYFVVRREELARRPAPAGGAGAAAGAPKAPEASSDTQDSADAEGSEGSASSEGPGSSEGSGSSEGTAKSDGSEEEEGGDE